jgi:hypothetical protein
MTRLPHRAPGAPFGDRLQVARPDRIASSRPAEAGLTEVRTGSPVA